jgi:ArsR family transcriptional regulator
MSECSHSSATSVRAPVTEASPETLGRAVDIFSAMGDPTRLGLLAALARGERCVAELACDSGVSQSAISHQLRLLRDRGLVACVRDGNRAIYRLADDHVRALLAEGLAHAREDLR